MAWILRSRIQVMIVRKEESSSYSFHIRVPSRVEKKWLIPHAIWWVLEGKHLWLTNAKPQYTHHEEGALKSLFHNTLVLSAQNPHPCVRPSPSGCSWLTCNSTLSDPPTNLILYCKCKATNMQPYFTPYAWIITITSPDIILSTRYSLLKNTSHLMLESLPSRLLL